MRFPMVHPSRRGLLQGTCGFFASATLPKLASAAGTRDPRFVVIVLRGALDGLSTVAPVGDPDYAGLHGSIALSLTGDHAALPLDATFALNPAMPVFAKLYAERQAAIIHAVATGYRDRSHFDGQDVLESGLQGPGYAPSGWLNRVIAALPRGEALARGGLAVGAATPLILRGSAPVVGWVPQTLPVAGDELAARVLDLYGKTDPLLATAMAEGLGIDKIAMREMGGDTKLRGGADSIAGMRQAAQGAARLMAADDGPRIAALTFDGWDTHVNEGGATGRLAQLLSGLDGAFEELQNGLGPLWKDTAVIAITEFGRTVKINGTTGTDHGTGTVALLAGGAIQGGRVIADWPGLRPEQLYEKRDLRPTTDLRAVVKGMLEAQFDLPPRLLGETVFPETAHIKPLQNLMA